MEPRKLVQRAVIAGAAMLAMISGVGGAGLLGQAHADNPDCVASVADQCPRLVDVPKLDPPPPRRIQTFCQPAGGTTLLSTVGALNPRNLSASFGA